MPSQSIELRYFSFKEIKFDIEAMPECLEHKEVPSSQFQTASLISTMTETSYREPLKVAQIESKAFLLPPYEVYKAWEHLLSDPIRFPKLHSTSVPCVTISIANKSEMIPLAVRLSALGGLPKAHLHRLINLQCLKNSVSYNEMKAILGIQANQASEKRQLQRDLRLLNFPNLLSRVVGIDLTKPDSPSLAQSLTKGRSIDVDMTAKQAELYLSKLRDDPEIIDSFLKAFDDEKRWQSENMGSPDDETKPFHKRRTFDFNRMLRIAENIALGYGHLNGESSEKSDFQWSPKISHDTGLTLVPDTRFSLYDASESNLKIMTAVAYNATQLANSLKAHIARIRPVKHGQNLKVKRSDLSPSISIHSNHPDLRDTSYIDFLRESHMLLYCNRQHLLRCLEIKPANFGFDSYRWDSTAQISKISSCFEDWWKNDFEVDVRKWHSGSAERHPAYKYVVHIKTFIQLEKSSHGNREFFLSTFINDAFSYVFSELELEDKQHREELSHLNSLRIRTTREQWKRIDSELRKSGKITLNTEQLGSLLSDTVSDFRDSIRSSIQHQNHKLAEQNSLLRDLTIGSQSVFDEDATLARELKGHYGIR